MNGDCRETSALAGFGAPSATTQVSPAAASAATGVAMIRYGFAMQISEIRAVMELEAAALRALRRGSSMAPPRWPPNGPGELLGVGRFLTYWPGSCGRNRAFSTL